MPAADVRAASERGGPNRGHGQAPRHITGFNEGAFIMKIKVAAAMLILAAIAFGSANVAAQETNQKKPVAQYACIMDRDVKSAKPGKCRECGMDLRLVKDDAEQSSAEEATAKSEAGATARIEIPDVTVYDQDGRKLRFYTDLVKGKTVAINFLFTTCTTICPPLAATFKNVQREMKEQAASDAQLISVSVDPTTDVPERLKGFLKKFNAGPGWSFVTGDRAEIERLLKSLGAFAGDKNDHTPMLLVGNDRAGYWTRTYGLAPASAIAAIINEAASKHASAP